jgi:hypothetical protein
MGYSSGVWRAEPGKELKAIDRFTAGEGEAEGPLVKDCLGKRGER